LQFQELIMPQLNQISQSLTAQSTKPLEKQNDNSFLALLELLGSKNSKSVETEEAELEITMDTLGISNVPYPQKLMNFLSQGVLNTEQQENCRTNQLADVPKNSLETIVLNKKQLPFEIIAEKPKTALALKDNETKILFPNLSLDENLSSEVKDLRKINELNILNTIDANDDANEKVGKLDVLGKKPKVLIASQSTEQISLDKEIEVGKALTSTLKNEIPENPSLLLRNETSAEVTEFLKYQISDEQENQPLLKHQIQEQFNKLNVVISNNSQEFLENEQDNLSFMKNQMVEQINKSNVVISNNSQETLKNEQDNLTFIKNRIQNKISSSNSIENNNFKGILEQTSFTNASDVSEPLVPIKEIPEFLLKQISSKVKHNKLDGSSEISLKLKPEELGKLTLRLAAHDGQVSVKILTASNQVRDLVEQNITQLKQSLTSQGIKCTNVDVQVGNESNLPQFLGQQFNPFNQSRNWSKNKSFTGKKGKDENRVNSIYPEESSNDNRKSGLSRLEILV